MLNTTENFIIDLLEKTAPVPGVTESEKRQYRYLDAGHISSFEVMSFIIEIEEHFDIVLSPEDTQSDAFRTIGGLASIIQQALTPE